MRPLWMWAEAVLAGGFYVAAGLFVTLVSAGRYDLGWLSLTKDYLTPASSVVLVAIFYVVGMAASEGPNIAIRAALKAFPRLKQKLYALASPVNAREQVAIWQHGSQRVHWGIDTSYYTAEMCKSLATAVPTFAIVFGFWSARAISSFEASIILVTGLVSGCVFFRAFIIHRAYLHDILQAAAEEVSRERSKP